MNQRPKETVLITGASSGIGLELARCFARDKSDLVLVARNHDTLERLAEELRLKEKINVHVIVCNLARPESPGELFEEIKGRGIAVDILVNNAGFGLHGSFVELPLSHQLEIIQVNVSALVALTGLFLPAMVKQGSGGILNVGSVAGFVPGPNMAIYYATKAFVLSFSEALKEELRTAGVTLTNLCPGPTETNFSKVARQHRVRISRTSKMTAAAVAQIGYEDFRAGKCLSIPGYKNRLVAFWGSRILPRAIVRQVSGKYNQLSDRE